MQQWKHTGEYWVCPKDGDYFVNRIYHVSYAEPVPTQVSCQIKHNDVVVNTLKGSDPLRSSKFYSFNFKITLAKGGPLVF